MMPNERAAAITDAPQFWADTMEGVDLEWIRQEIAAAISAAVAEEREACAKWLDAEASMYIGDDDDPCAAAIWQQLMNAAVAIRTRGG